VCVSCGGLHFTAGRQLRTHVDECGLHVISDIAHGGGAVRETGLLEAPQRGIQEVRDDRL
jgi:hypothetical protein